MIIYRSGQSPQVHKSTKEKLDRSRVSLPSWLKRGQGELQDFSMSGANPRKFWRVEAEGVPLADLFFVSLDRLVFLSQLL